MDFSFPIPQHQSLFLFGFSQTKGEEKKKNQKKLPDARNMSCEPQSQSRGQLWAGSACCTTGLPTGPRSPAHSPILHLLHMLGSL